MEKTIVTYPTTTSDTISEVYPDTIYSYKHLIDTAVLRERLSTADSTLRPNDSTYIFLTCPNYTFVKDYDIESLSSEKALSSVEIYHILEKNDPQPNNVALTKRMSELIIKYSAKNKYYYREDALEQAPSSEDTYDVAIAKKYHLGEVRDGISNIVYKKDYWNIRWSDFLRVFYYTTLIITLLIFMFLHNTIKAFCVTLLSGLLICILTGLIVALSVGGEEEVVLYFMIGYYILFIFLSFSIFNIHVRRTFQAIGLNLFLFMTPFIPIICVVTYMTAQRNYYRNTYEYGPNTTLYMKNYLPVAEIAGFILFLILLQPVFRKLYRKWYAAPED